MHPELGEVNNGYMNLLKFTKVRATYGFIAFTRGAKGMEIIGLVHLRSLYYCSVFLTENMGCFYFYFNIQGIHSGT